MSPEEEHEFLKVHKLLMKSVSLVVGTSSSGKEKRDFSLAGGKDGEEEEGKGNSEEGGLVVVESGGSYMNKRIASF